MFHLLEDGGTNTLQWYRAKKRWQNTNGLYKGKLTDSELPLEISDMPYDSDTDTEYIPTVEFYRENDIEMYEKSVADFLFVDGWPTTPEYSARLGTWLGFPANKIEKSTKIVCTEFNIPLSKTLFPSTVCKWGNTVSDGVLTNSSNK